MAMPFAKFVTGSYLTHYYLTYKSL